MQRAKRIGKEIEWWLRELRVAPKVLREYGTRFPDRVNLPGTNICIYIDPTDRRARKKILFDLIRGRSNRNGRFWTDFISYIEPTTALDIGANFGECVFAMTYSPNIRVIAFEANPELVHFLKKSQRDHPSVGQIEIINALVSDEDGGDVPFYLNRGSSGRSTAVASIAADAGGVEKISVSSVRVDDVLSARGILPEKLVFKVDVEGYEPNVMAGMRRSVEKSSLSVGYVELDSVFLHRTGWTIERYDQEIVSDFELFVPVDKKSLVLKKHESLGAYRNFFGEARIHTDLILLRNPKGFDWLPPAWRLAQ